MDAKFKQWVACTLTDTLIDVVLNPILCENQPYESEHLADFIVYTLICAHMVDFAGLITALVTAL